MCDLGQFGSFGPMLQELYVARMVGHQDLLQLQQCLLLSVGPQQVTYHAIAERAVEFVDLRSFMEFAQCRFGTFEFQ